MYLIQELYNRYMPLFFPIGTLQMPIKPPALNTVSTGREHVLIESRSNSVLDAKRALSSWRAQTYSSNYLYLINNCSSFMVMYTLWSEESSSHPSYGLTSAFTYRLLWLHLPQVSKRLRKFHCVSPGHFSFGINIINFCRRKLGRASARGPDPNLAEQRRLYLT